MALPRAIRAVVFDMDGLLLDTEVVFRDAFLGAALGFGQDAGRVAEDVEAPGDDAVAERGAAGHRCP